MKQFKRRSKLIASGLMVMGVLLAAIGFFSGAKFSIIQTDDGLKAVGKEDRKQEEWDLKEFKSLEIDVADADIEIIPSEEFRLEVERMEGNEITQEVNNNTLILKEKNTKSIFSFSMNLSGNIQRTIIKVYIPKVSDLDDVNIDNKFGDIKMDGMNINNLSIQSNDGTVNINEIKANSLTVHNKFGNITASNVNTTEITLESNDGDINLSKMNITKNADFINLFGDTTLRDFTSNGTKIESTDGEININGELFGQSVIESNFGDVQLALANKESELSYDIHNSFGSIMVNGTELVTKSSNSGQSEDKLNIRSKDGDIDVTLE
ncbi:DUF4097 family beta strand repeat-containing protein [Bacillus sp. B1-b2]|uniref:DUF4097 family beta strand repeat-containing protein n=1 Tax=Bacillus sp. B1-b2 TaxID=2653201 RepID=UPI001261E515|nr:DUF4097 family beta strand repeat-containing protein [Bacillus sp. B1-b2]KAB7672140.1 DUF4097 domain-containing protein [Bacillus sp. B1-b2]